VNKTNKSRMILPNHFRVSRSDCKCISTETNRLAGPAGDGQPDGEGRMERCERGNTLSHSSFG